MKYTMALIPEDAHVMLAAAVSTRNITLITDTIMCITDLVTEIQGRFMVVVKPNVGKPMTFGSSRMDSTQSPPTSFPCSRCDRKFESLEELTAHSKSHIDDEVHSATQRLHSLSNANEAASAWPLSAAPSQTASSPSESQPSPSLPPGGLSSQQQSDVATQLKCPLCSKTFNKIFHLNLHLTRHQEGKGNDMDSTVHRTYSCRLCSREFNHLSSRNKHERICKQPGSSRMGRSLGSSIAAQVYNCRRCKKPYADNANRLRHERMCRSGTNPIALASAASPTVTATDSSAKAPSGGSIELPISVSNYKHMASTAVSMKVLDENGRQTTMYSCVICAKLVQTRSSLESHYMSHLGIKPHACQWCCKRFTDASNWRKHQRNCTERPADDTSAGPPSMAPPISTFNFPADASLPNDYPTNGGNIPAAETEIKSEKIDISTMADPQDVDVEEGQTAELSFDATISSGDEGKLTVCETEQVEQQTAETTMEDEESEENKLINTANSVVVDSALSWFVEDKELTALHQDREEPMA